jgi:PIN domain nuclease of toxin-antitoxin system
VKVLLDTHAFLWFVWGDPRLTTAAETAISDPLNDLMLSLASCWEMAIKASIGKLTLDVPTREFVLRETAANNLNLLTITLDHVTAVQDLPKHHRDPFDRLLAAQAQIEKLAIVSSDGIFDAYGIARMW